MQCPVKWHAICSVVLLPSSAELPWAGGSQLIEDWIDWRGAGGGGAGGGGGGAGGAGSAATER